MALAAVLNQAEVYWFEFVIKKDSIKIYVEIKNDVPRVYVIGKIDKPYIRTKYNN